MKCTEIFVKVFMLIVATFTICYYLVLFVARTNSFVVLEKCYGIALLLIVFLMIIQLFKSRESIRLSSFSIKEVKENLIGVVVSSSLICFQTLRLGVGTFTQIRDSVEYDPLVCRMVERGIIYGSVSEWTDNPIQLIWISPKYVTTPWYVFEAWIARTLHVHSSIVTRTIIPIVVLLLAYCSLWLLAEKLFDSYSQRIIFILICAFLYEGAVEWNEPAAYLLIWPSWGKTITVTSVSVLIAASFVGMVQKERIDKEELFWLVIYVIVGTASSAAAMMAIPVELGALCLARIIQSHRWKCILIGAVAIIPCVVEFAIYYLYTSHTLDFWFLGA